MRKSFEDWFSKIGSSQQNQRASGAIKAPTRENLISWIPQALVHIYKSLIIKFFKVCGLSLALDGSEDHLLSTKLTDLEEIRKYTLELEQMYLEFENHDQPYEDLPILIQDLRDNEALVYDVNAQFLFGL